MDAYTRQRHIEVGATLSGPRTGSAAAAEQSQYRDLTPTAARHFSASAEFNDAADYVRACAGAMAGPVVDSLLDTAYVEYSMRVEDDYAYFTGSNLTTDLQRDLDAFTRQQDDAARAIHALPASRATDPPRIAPADAERGVGALLAKDGRTDIARTLSDGGAHPNARSLAREWGVSEAQAAGRSATLPAGMHGAAADYLDRYADGELERIEPRQRAESRERWLGRIRAKLAAEQRAASGREMRERSKSSGLGDKAQRRYAMGARIR